MRQRTRTRLMLALLLSLVVSALVGMMIFKNYQDLRDALVQAQQNHLRTIAENTAKTIESYIASQEKALFLLVNQGLFLDKVNPAEQTSQGLAEYLQFYFDVEKPKIDGVELYGPNDDLLAVYPASHALSAYRQDLEAAQQTHTATVGKVFFEGGKPSLTLSQPFFQDGNFQGIIRCRLNVDYIYQTFVKPVQVKGKGYASVKSKELVFIMHPRKDQIGKNVIEERTSEYPEFDWTDFVTLMKSQTNGGSGAAIYYSLWVTEEDPTRVKKYSGFASARVGSSFWIVTVSSDYRETVGVIRNNYYYTLFLVLGFVVISILVVIYISYIKGEQKKLLIEHKLFDKMKKINEELQADIAQRKSLEEQLSSSRSKYKALFDGGSDCVFVVSLESDDLHPIDEVNDKVMELFGYSRVELESMKMEDIAITDFHFLNRATLHEAKNQRAVLFETDLAKKNGELIPVEINARCVSLNDTWKIIMFCRDILERRVAERAIKRSRERFLRILNSIAAEMRHRENVSVDYIGLDDSKTSTAMKLESINIELGELFKKELDENKKKEALMVSQSRYAAMGEMINNIAHQWRQPLNVLSLVVSNIEDGLAENQALCERVQPFLVKIYQIIKSMSETIDDFKDFFNPRQKRVNFPLKETILSCHHLCSERLEHNQIKLKTFCRENLTAYGYANQMSQVLLNLIHNSIDALIAATTVVKRIEIAVSVQGQDTIEIKISDTGDGVPPDYQEKIFDPYFTTKDRNGTGIGLYMTKLIIEKNFDGTVRYLNIERGACFLISVPSGRARYG